MWTQSGCSGRKQPLLRFHSCQFNNSLDHICKSFGPTCTENECSPLCTILKIGSAMKEGNSLITPTEDDSHPMQSRCI